MIMSIFAGVVHTHSNSVFVRTTPPTSGPHPRPFRSFLALQLSKSRHRHVFSHMSNYCVLEASYDLDSILRRLNPCSLWNGGENWILLLFC